MTHGTVRSHDDQHARDYSAQIHRLNDEPAPDNQKPTWRRRVVAGVVLATIAYLVTSCFIEQRLHQPKIERVKLRFEQTANGK